ncbi:hypothetical protein GBAR_LOCUS22949 [Geodia barretti]|uniref:Endonuclease/exonuclease/phosphatase domain-containing protein n=1 Tax=Geodia barretti TaxID=519541 RepID=A0AA35X0Y5_GEOBA|nr:hypothetical protein GBAR_LOCUS22949 [Geodia barretti]
MEPKTEVGEEVLCKPKREMEPKTEEEQKEVKCKPMLKTVKELKTAEKGEEIKVLLWNINGYSLDKEKSAEGEVEIKVMGSGITPPARHAIVASVVEEKDPDILLLQEITTQVIVGEIVKAGKVKGREYKQIVPKKEEGAKKTSSEEARVLYDTKKFESQLRRNELGLAIETLDKDKTTTYNLEKERTENRERQAWGKLSWSVWLGLPEEKGWPQCRQKDHFSCLSTITTAL